MATPADDPNVTLTIRLIMQGKEVGSIIGKKGEIVKKFREESGARINISDGSSPERIVTITGSTNGIIKAFDLICRKLEEVYNMPKADNVPKPPITLRLIVPASQCGSLIGKGGSKIREIREVTGASIQVASEMLPNSTERAVTISGMSDAITKCIYHICMIMLESPPKGGTIPYRPRPGPAGPGGMMMGQAGAGGGYGMQGNYGINPAEQMGKMGGSPLAGLAALGLGGIGGGPNAGPVNPADKNNCACFPPAAASSLVEPSSSAIKIEDNVMELDVKPSMEEMQLQLSQESSPYYSMLSQRVQEQTYSSQYQRWITSSQMNQHNNWEKNKCNRNAMFGGYCDVSRRHPNRNQFGNSDRNCTHAFAPLAALAAIAGSQLRTGSNRQQQNQQTNHVQQEMTVPNELIGCVIGKGGTKIAEIRQISGAMIRISNSEELREGCSDRVITITGNPDSVALAQYLINMSVELQKANLEAQNKGEGGNSSNGGGSTQGTSSGGGSATSPSNSSSSAVGALSALPPLAKLLSNPLFTSLSALGSLGSLNELLNSAASLPALGGAHPPVQTTGVHRRSHNSFQPKLKTSGSPPPKSKSDRNKFAPY